MTDEGLKIREEGALAFCAGKHPKDNPYGQSTGYQSYSWSAGFRSARTARMKAREAR